jgi:hypothetical protein
MQRRALCTAAALASLGVRAAPKREAAGSASAVLPLQGDEVGPAYFGIHFHRLVPVAGQPELPTRWPAGAVGSLRLWDAGTRWGDVSPQPGVWRFDRLDAHVEAAEAQGASLLYTLGSTPRWASARPNEPGPYGPGCAAEPVRLAHWEEYLRRVAERYRGRIQAYELWNEPQFSDYERDRQSPGFFTGSVARMIELAQAARRVLDRVDPAAILTTPGFVNGPHRLDLFLRSGGASLVQAVAYHFYAQDALHLARQVIDVRVVMQQNGVAGLPLWNTECGVETYGDTEALPEGIHERLSASGAGERVAQLVLMGAAARLGRFYYYAWDNDRSGMVNRQGEPNPREEAWRRVQAWLLGAQVRGMQATEQGLVSIDATRAGERCLFAWCRADPSSRMPVPAGWRIAACEPLYSGALPGWPLPGQDADAVALTPAPQRVTLVRV